MHRSERISGHFRIFGPGLSRYLARLLAPLRPQGPMATDALQDPAQVTVPSPDPRAPMRVSCLAAPRLRPVCRTFRRACVAVPFLTRCVLRWGVKGARGPARCLSLEAHTSRSIWETWGWSPLRRDRAYKEESIVWVSCRQHSGRHGGLRIN